jgi:hypothetical protein
MKTTCGEKNGTWVRKLASLVAALVLGAVFVIGSGRSTMAASQMPITQEPSAQEPVPTVNAMGEMNARSLTAEEAAYAAQASGVTEIVPEGPRWTLWGDAESKVGSAMLVVDNADGLHIAYNHFTPLVEKPRAIYLYCPESAACEKGEGWIGVEFGTDVLRVMLAATTAGKPRMLVQQQGVVFGSGKDYYYAACDDACDAVDNWQIGYVTSTWGTEVNDAFDYGKTVRAFALDAQDRPGFVFYDRNYFHYEPDHTGGFYTWCESDCATGTPDEKSWKEVYIGGGSIYDTDIYSLPVLQYTSDSKPRVLVEVTTGDAGKERMGIIYKSCETNCDQSASWRHTKVADRGHENYVGYDMTLDAQNRPHVSFYQGSFENSQGHVLQYLYCASACHNVSNWKTLSLGLERGEGESPDIEMQPNGKPAITYLHKGGLAVYLARCTGNCTSAAGWKHTILDTDADLEDGFPVPLPTTCDAGFWDAESTRLAFDSKGQLRVVYDAAYQARCLYQDPTRPQDPPYYRFHQLRHSVRVLIWEPVDNGGGEPGAVKVMIPIVMGQ